MPGTPINVRRRAIFSLGNEVSGNFRIHSVTRNVTLHAHINFTRIRCVTRMRADTRGTWLASCMARDNPSIPRYIADPEVIPCQLPRVMHFSVFISRVMRAYFQEPRPKDE